MPDRQRRRFYQSLTPAERAAVRAVRRGSQLPSITSTARVHLSRAKVIFDKQLFAWRRSPA